MAETHHIKVAKTARYLTLGTLNEQTKEVWIALHGYAHQVEEFIDQFDNLNDGSRFIVAPEGLNRFYSRGLGGKPVATWMTSKDRENEITDYINYLDALYESLQIPEQTNIILLGFSQGVATASRFLHHSHRRFNHFVLYAGEIAFELVNPISPRIANIPLTYVTGNQDPLITPEKHAEVLQLMEQLHAQTIRFEGGHVVLPEVLQQVASSLLLSDQ